MWLGVLIYAANGSSDANDVSNANLRQTSVPLPRDERLERSVHAWVRLVTSVVGRESSAAGPMARPSIAFDGWKELGRGERFTTPPRYAPLIVWKPRVWLLTTGWLRHGLIGTQEIPGGNDDDD